MSDSYEISEELLADIRRIRRKVDGFNGPGVVNTHDGLSFSPSAEAVPATPPEPDRIVSLLITATARLGGAYMATNLTGGISQIAGTSSGFFTSNFGQSHPTNRNVLVLNPLESTSSNHAIVVPTGGFPATGLLIGLSSDTTPVPIAILMEGYLPPMLFWVKTSQSGGSDGGSNTAATYTYNVTNQASLVGLGFAPTGTMAVTMARPLGSVHAATNGIMFLAGTNQNLIWVDETPNDNVCPP